MKLTLTLLLVTGCCYAQTPATVIRRDSVPVQEVPPPPISSDRMPIVRPSTSFYRLKTDPKNVMRATIDNMPVKTSDSSTYYTMMNSVDLQYRYKMKPFMQPLVPPLFVYPPRKRQ